MHQHASWWRAAAVRSCDAGLVDHTECPETVSVCKRTVARAASRFQYVLVGLRLSEDVYQDAYEGLLVCALKLASFYYEIPS